MTETIVADSNSSAIEPVQVPSPNEVPKEGKQEPRFGKRNNLAGDEDTCRAFWGYASNCQLRYKTQRQRAAWYDGVETTPAKLDTMDRMWRMSERKDTSSAQHQNTLSDVTSHIYFDTTRTISSALATIALADDELPAQYEAELNTEEYDASIGRELAQKQQLLEVFTFDEDKRRTKIKKLIKFNEKNCNQMGSIEWVYETREIVERVPKGIDENGLPTGFKFAKKTHVTKDWPTLILHDIKDIWIDAQIDSMDEQRCFLIRTKVPYEKLVNQQVNGFIKNVDKIKASHFYRDEEGENVLRDRGENSGEDFSPEPDGLVEVWHVKAWVPIKEKARKGKLSGKGEWNAKFMPEYYWGTFAGHPNESSVCLRLEKDPYWAILGRSNYRFFHSEDDDKGAYHDGVGTRAESLYWEACTNLNQAIDNKTMRNKAFFVADGPVKTRDLTFRQNKLVRIGKGVNFERFEPGDTTQITMKMQQYIESTFMKLAGADKPLSAEALGSRTSATESKNIFDMAMMPLDEKTRYIFEDQLFPWMFEVDAALWRHWADPKRKLQITHQGETLEVIPSELWGPVKTKVTAVTRFRNNIVSRQELNSLLQGTYPMAEKYMGSNGPQLLWRQVYGNVINNVDEIFPIGRDFDAEQNAIRGRAILMSGQWVEPNQDENQEVWLRLLKPARAELNYFTDEDVPNRQEIMRALDQHIAMREQFIAQRQQQISAQSQPPTLEGEATGDLIEGQEGAQAGGIQ